MLVGRGREDGAAAVELALVLPLLVILLFGTVQLALAFNRAQGMHAASREGARLASVGETRQEVVARVASSLEGTTIDAGDVEVTIRGFLDGANPTHPNPGVPILLDDLAVCDELTGFNSLRLDLEIAPGVDDYDVRIPFLPPVEMSFESNAVFRCEA